MENEEQQGEEIEDVGDVNYSLEAFIAYLESEKGHELASNVLQSFTDFKKAQLEAKVIYSDKLQQARSFNYKYTLAINSIILVAAIGTATFLTFQGKFDSTIGVFFGTILGYVFSKPQAVK